jgi:hypothetical protein
MMLVLAAVPRPFFTTTKSILPIKTEEEKNKKKVMVAAIVTADGGFP